MRGFSYIRSAIASPGAAMKALLTEGVSMQFALRCKGVGEELPAARRQLKMVLPAERKTSRVPQVSLD